MGAVKVVQSHAKSAEWQAVATVVDTVLNGLSSSIERNQVILFTLNSNICVANCEINIPVSTQTCYSLSFSSEENI